MAKGNAWFLALILGGVSVHAASSRLDIAGFVAPQILDTASLAPPPAIQPVPSETSPTTPTDETAPDPGLNGPVALPNFHLVSPGIYRSAQPNRQGFSQLASGQYPEAARDLFGNPISMKTILNLRNLDSIEGPVIRQEQALAKSLGMIDVLDPIGSDKTPSFQQIDTAINIMINPAKWPVLVHCRDGKDRTGFVVAAYRVSVEKMGVDQAVAEANSFGCCQPRFMDLKTFLTEYLQYRAGTGPSQPSAPADRPAFSDHVKIPE